MTGASGLEIDVAMQELEASKKAQQNAERNLVDINVLSLGQCC